MDYMKELHDLCMTIKEEIADANEKIKNAGGKLSPGDIDYIDKLTHSLKSVKAVIAMMEEDGDGEYSGDYPYMVRTSYRSDGSYRGGRSYARGRTNARRDSMGRYSGRGYSRAEGDMHEIVEELRGMMDSLPEEKRHEVERFVEKVDRM